ncbi:CAP domain-containing protein [Leuconostocaceae bacterium ESL0958]|nr:CAP domain-containing protein [Leuconostocaceae bacterium ESL0958]
MKNKVTKTILATAAGAAAFAGAHAAASADQVSVKDGDTLSQIAEDHNTTVDELVAKNQIENADLIFAGDLLTTDGSGVTVAPAAAPTATANQDQAAVAQAQAATAEQPQAQAQANTNPQNQASTTNVSYQAPAASGNGADASVQGIVDAMNAKRAALGLAPVQYDASLSARAQGRAEEANANGGLPSGHMAQVAGPEVVAIGFGAGSVVDAWYNETNMIAAPAHRNWLTNPSFTRVGFGVSGSTIVGLAG